jgi:hypothetical protein
MIDSRNHFTVLLDSTCDNCKNNLKYIRNENATKENDLIINKVSNPSR